MQCLSPEDHHGEASTRASQQGAAGCHSVWQTEVALHGLCRCADESMDLLGTSSSSPSWHHPPSAQLTACVEAQLAVRERICPPSL